MGGDPVAFVISMNLRRRAVQVDAESHLVAVRAYREDERDEQESLLDLYLRAMESAGSSQAEAA